VLGFALLPAYWRQDHRQPRPHPLVWPVFNVHLCPVFKNSSPTPSSSSAASSLPPSPPPQPAVHSARTPLTSCSSCLTHTGKSTVIHPFQHTQSALPCQGPTWYPVHASDREPTAVLSLPSCPVPTVVKRGKGFVSHFHL
jgi:hypothetical protein